MGIPLLGRYDGRIGMTGAVTVVSLAGRRSSGALSGRHDRCGIQGRQDNYIDLEGATMAITNELKAQYRGQDLKFNFTHTPAGSDPLSISGWNFKFLLLQNGSSKFTKTTGFAITNAASGLMDFSLAPEDTSSLEPGEYDIALWRTDDGSEVVLADGCLKLK